MKLVTQKGSAAFAICKCLMDQNFTSIACQHSGCHQQCCVINKSIGVSGNDQVLLRLHALGEHMPTYTKSLSYPYINFIFFSLL